MISHAHDGDRGVLSYRTFAAAATVYIGAVTESQRVFCEEGGSEVLRSG